MPKIARAVVAGTAAGLEVVGSGKPPGPAFLAVQTVPIDSLRPYKNNARTHDENQLKALRASMLEFGWTIPILVDEDNNVLAGHARLTVGRELGYVEAPVMVAKGWTAAQKKAYILADNKLTERGGWDWKMVSAELKDLQAAAFNLSLTGFESYELEPLLAAHWVPPVAREKEKMNGDGAGDGEQAINVTPLQFRTFMEGVGRAREKSGNDKLTNGDALMLMVEAYE